MYQEEVVLCGASAYSKKFYLNDLFDGLPQSVKDELKILCVLYTEDVGGTIRLLFDEEGCLQVRTDSDEGDLLFDEIGSALKVKEMQRNKEALFESLEMFYRVFCLGEDFEED